MILFLMREDKHSTSDVFPETAVSSPQSTTHKNYKMTRGKNWLNNGLTRLSDHQGTQEYEYVILFVCVIIITSLGLILSRSESLRH